MLLKIFKGTPVEIGSRFWYIFLGLCGCAALLRVESDAGMIALIFHPSYLDREFENSLTHNGMLRYYHS
jgi:hypothetical protein